MDERQLRILRELGDLGSVSAVAEALHVTPSAVSQQLRLLQRSIPVPLTERSGRRLVLTDAGQLLAAAAIQVETALTQARHTITTFTEQPDAPVSLAAFHSAASAFFPLLLHNLANPGPQRPPSPTCEAHPIPAAHPASQPGEIPTPNPHPGLQPRPVPAPTPGLDRAPALDAVGPDTRPGTGAALDHASGADHPGSGTGVRRPRLTLADEDVAQDRFPVLTRQYDLVLAHRLDHAASWPRTVTAATLLREPLDVALPIGHPLAENAVLSPRQVADQPWITVHDGFPLMSTIEAIAAVANRRLDIVHRINEFAVVAEVVAAGGGIALMPRWTTRPHPGIVLRPLTGVHARRRIDVLHRPERTARLAVRIVLAELHRAAIQIQSTPHSADSDPA